MNLLHTLDSLTANFFLSLRTPLLTQVFEFITVFGSPLATAIITLIVAIIIYKKHRAYLTPILTTSIGAGITIYTTKIFFHRLRPLDALVTEKSFSFPSGHALIAIALYGLLTYITYLNLKNKSQKIATVSIGTILILLIGISRLYLGVHYASDVLGGYIIGSLWLAVGVVMLKLRLNSHLSI